MASSTALSIAVQKGYKQGVDFQCIMENKKTYANIMKREFNTCRRNFTK